MSGNITPAFRLDPLHKVVNCNRASLKTQNAWLASQQEACKPICRSVVYEIVPFSSGTDRGEVEPDADYRCILAWGIGYTDFLLVAQVLTSGLLDVFND